MAAKKSTKRKQQNKPSALLTVVIVAILAVVVLAGGGDLTDVFNAVNAWLETGEFILDQKPAMDYAAQLNGGVEMVFIDVGQGDSTLITDGTHHVLIDGGDRGAGEAVLEVLEKYGITELTAVVATHPHADHIAGLVEVLDVVTAKHIYMPDATNNVSYFEKLLDQIESQNMEVTIPKRGSVVSFGNTFKLTFVSPLDNKSYDDLNEISLVTRVDTAAGSALIMGDAGKVAEKEMLADAMPVQVDIFRIGHHGSSGSTIADFLAAVDPQVAVISVGEGNDYGHPTEVVLERLEDYGCTILRTDEKGHITCRFAEGKAAFTFEK